MKKIIITSLAILVGFVGIVKANTTFSSFVTGLTQKSTPAAADKFYLNDLAGGNVDKYTTFSNIESTLNIANLTGSLNFSALTGTCATTQGCTGITTWSTGEIPVATASNVLSRLGAGSEGQYLKIVSGLPSWATLSAGTVTTLTAGTGITFSSGSTCTSTCTINSLGGGGGAGLSVSTSTNPQLAGSMLYMNSANATSTAVATSSLFISPTTSNIGVSTTTPVSKLEVNGGFHTDLQTLSTSTSMSVDFCSQATSNMLRMARGNSNITFTWTNYTSCLGKTIEVFDEAPLSSPIATTTFTPVFWNGQQNPGSGVASGITDHFKFTATSSTTPSTGLPVYYIAGRLVEAN